MASTCFRFGFDMARKVEPWVGKDDNQPAPQRVRLRVWDRCEGRCHACQRKILVGEKWVLEHLVALINGGANAEHNLCLTCCNCLPEKNAKDVAEKSAVNKSRAKNLGLKKPKRPMFGSKASGWRKKMDGTVERR